VHLLQEKQVDILSADIIKLESSSVSNVNSLSPKLWTTQTWRKRKRKGKENYVGYETIPYINLFLSKDKETYWPEEQW